ncbi:MAG TPA: DNA cytosine methyltransferase [Candidatus Saccharimonadales bacterium]|nr:DNA cytosine methyltransferase [Candidatus Saccharimonadales bacterium]
MSKDLIQQTKVIDLFCGIGGLTHGLKNVGFDVVAGIDNDKTCEYGYEASNGADFIAKDIADVHASELEKLYKGAKYKVLIGCAPCQPYSKLNRRSYTKEKQTPIEKFAELVEQLKPDIVSMENVRGLANKEKYPIFGKFLNTLEKNGYKYSYQVINTSDYGVPQSRNRLVLLASRHGDIALIEKTHKEHKVTVKDVISNLQPLKDGEASDSDPLHRARKLSPLNKTRISLTPKDGGDQRSWPEELLLECHKKPSGKSFTSVYGRMRWDQPSPTMTTQCTGIGNGRFGHPEQDRAITLREAALFQTFPTDYKFYDPKKDVPMGQVAKFIGNAVPVRLGEVIGESIRNHLLQEVRS